MITDELKGWAIAIALIAITNCFSYYFGKETQKTEQAKQITQLQASNAKLLQQRESQTAQINSQYQQAIQQLTVRNERLQDEIKQEAKQIDRTNHITKQFNSLLNASTNNAASISTNPRDDAGTSTCSASRMLGTMVQNNVNHEACIHQVRLWQDWYKLNFGDKILLN